MNDSSRRIGDRVSVSHPKYPGVWVIKSFGPKNTVLEPEDGGRGLRVPHWMVTDPGAPAMPTATTTLYSPGEIVRVLSGRFAGLYVVIADKGEKVNIALLGGDGGRYVRYVKRPGDLKRVSLADLLEGDTW